MTEQPIQTPPSPAQTSTPSPSDPLIAVNRGSLGLIVVGLTFFIVGVLVGVLAYDRFASNNRAENEELLSAAVATFAAVVPQGGGNQVVAQPTRDPNARYEVSADDDPFLGAEDAPIQIVSFEDFRCGFCKRFNDQTIEPLLAEYGDRVRFVFRDYPILGPDSVQAALAGECAHDQDKFWELHTLLYADQILTRDAFIAHATALEMDVPAFTECLDNAVYQSEIQADYQAGASVGVGGTPTFFINGRILVGAQPLESFVQYIEEELAAQAS